jgi:hypothetical protein
VKWTDPVPLLQILRHRCLVGLNGIFLGGLFHPIWAHLRVFGGRSCRSVRALGVRKRVPRPGQSCVTPRSITCHTPVNHVPHPGQSFGATCLGKAVPKNMCSTPPRAPLQRHTSSRWTLPHDAPHALPRATPNTTTTNTGIKERVHESRNTRQVLC